MNDVKIKQQIVEKIKSSTNILVTVSNNPSVDALSAALGLTVMLNKLGKHTTAVFSGSIPPAITFLDPEKTFEATIDSLRDFIIALDKEKADHLRYKVEGDAVKIFITPYRTTISSDDLEFSQGDYNVELVLALGVDDQDHLDGALEAHGRILHDATVATVSAGEQISQLGSLDWRDEQASSLSEMLVSLGDSLKADKPLLDKQIATALLTGIVAATDRFSNTKTSSKAMTVAAQLMAAGADQQLIAAKLQESHEIGSLVEPTNNDDDGTPMSENTSTKIDRTPEPPVAPPSDGGLEIKHDAPDTAPVPVAEPEPVSEPTSTIEPVPETLEDIANEVKVQDQEEAADVAEQVLADRIESMMPTPAPVVDVPTSEPETPKPLSGAVDWKPNSGEPSLGGTLNATTEQAEEDSRRELANDQNKTILSHSYLGGQPEYSAPMNGTAPSEEDADVNVFSDRPSTSAAPEAPTMQDAMAQELSPTHELVLPVPGGQTLADLDAQNRDNSGQDALAAVHATFGDQSAQPYDPAAGIGLPLPPPLPDFSTMPPPPAMSGYAPEQPPMQPEILGDIFAPENPPSPQQPPVADDPGQFKIPGQQ